MDSGGWIPRSLRPEQLKRNPSVLLLSSSRFRSSPSLLQLIPLLAFTAAGGLWAAYYLGRLAIKSPEVM